MCLEVTLLQYIVHLIFCFWDLLGVALFMSSDLSFLMLGSFMWRVDMMNGAMVFWMFSSFVD